MGSEAGVQSPPTSAGSAEPHDAASSPKTVVTISRTHETDVQQRQIIVRIDDGAPKTLIYGESVTLDVAPGAHVLYAHNTLVRKKIAFDAKPGERVGFAVVNRAGSSTLGFLALLGVAPLYLTVERIQHTNAV